MNEQWKPSGLCPGYEVSSSGQVRQIGTQEPLPMGRNPSGYPTVRVLRVVSNSVHSLVADAFHGPRPTGLVIRHLNDDKYDFRPSNLSYGTHQQNADDRVRNGHHLAGAVRVQRSDSVIYPSIAAAARANDCCTSTIRRAIDYQSTFCGYKFCEFSSE